MDRRSFILGAAATGIIGNTAHDAVVRTVEKMWALVTDHLPREIAVSERIPADISEPVKALFRGKGEVLKIAGGRAHYQYPKMMHPDDKWACELVAQYARKLAEKYQFDPDLLIPSLAGSFVCTGSPVSNALTRAFFEYIYVDQARPDLGLRRLQNPVLDLPFQFELRAKVLRAVAKSTRHSPEAGKAVSNWSIRHRSGDFFIPNTQEMKSDLLLISRIPNWLEPRARYQEFRNSVTIVGGTHGVGTSAIKLLLEDIDLLKRVLLRANQHEYWQVLLTVDKMKNGAHPHSQRTRLIAQSINPHFLCEPVNV